MTTPILLSQQILPTKHIKPYYIDNKVFLQSIITHRKAVRKAKRLKEQPPQVPEFIGQCFIDIANNLANKANFINYSFREDMILDAIENCLTYVNNFDPKKSSNPFAYFTQITYYAFVRRIQKEKRQLHTKYRYIESLDVDSLISQAGDAGVYGNAYVDFLKDQVDTAHMELHAIKQDVKVKRKPLYLQSLESPKENS